MLSARVQRIGFSPTMQINNTAQKMRADGIDVIDLSVGEPDYPTPENIKEAGRQAITGNITKYTPNSGLPELKAAIIHRIFEDQSLVYAPEEIIVSSGAKNCLYNLCMAILNSGDEVIIPAPYWVSYPAMIELANAVPVFVNTREADGFRLQPADLRAAITGKTKAIFFNNPCNPTGTLYSREHLVEIVEIAVTNNLIIATDEVYEKLAYDGRKLTSVAAISEQAQARTVVVNGVSKAYAMTGWRIGWAAGPKEIISAMNSVQSHNTSNASSVSQMAAIEALRGSQTSITMMVSEYEKRRNFVFSRLCQIPAVTCVKTEGAFYLFPNVSAYFDREHAGKRIKNSFGLVYYLLEQAHVALVPGAAFGMENFIRFSYSSAMDDLERAMKRLEEGLAGL